MRGRLDQLRNKLQGRMRKLNNPETDVAVEKMIKNGRDHYRAGAELLEVEHAASHMMLEKRLVFQRRHRVKEEHDQVGPRAKKKMNVRKWLNKGKSLADVTKALQKNMNDDEKHF